jgi:peptidoglycan/LPS O-acetylase OafA/YrhL
MKSSSFIKDIQGLRGVAIFFVLFFHFYPKIFPKGFLGVDLFFVISGYLITLIYFKKKYSFLIFFSKRLQRLGPSILTIILFSIILSFIILLPADLSNFFNSVLSTIFFVPNIYFLLKSGYFANINELKPLLNMWSLGVEIQFYFFFPILLFLIKTYKKKEFIKYIFFLFISSLSLDLILLFYNFNDIAFFLLPTRLWEFCFGSLAFVMPKVKLHKIFYFILYYFSIFIIFILLIFPELEIILFARKFLLIFFTSLIIYIKNPIKNDIFFLGNFFFQFLGKISYSLYLFHWPFLVFVKYYFVKDISNIAKFILLILVIFLSYLFWLLIENKFRYKFKPLIFFKTSLIFVFLILFLFFINLINKSFPERISEKALLISNSIDSNYRCDFFSYVNFSGKRNCKILFNKDNSMSKIVLLGNSHAQMYGYAFEEILNEKNLNGTIVSLNACLPTTKINITEDCIIKAKNNLNNITSNKNIDIVFIGLTWDHSFLIDINSNKVDNYNNLALSEAVYDLIKNIENFNIKTVLIGPISLPNYQYASTVGRNVYFKHKVDFNNYKETKNEFEIRFYEFFNFFEKKNYLNIVRPHLIQCDSGECLFSLDGNSLFSDNTHLSKFGSLLMKSSLLQKFNSF